MQNLEHYEQSAAVRWARSMEIKWPELFLLYAIPNGAKRNPRQGAWMKSEGLKSGVPDLCLPVPRGTFTGLYIEMKSEKGRLQPNQKEWAEALKTQGHLVVTCHSAEAAIKIMQGYMALAAKVGLGIHPVEAYQSLGVSE